MTFIREARKCRDCNRFITHKKLRACAWWRDMQYERKITARVTFFLQFYCQILRTHVSRSSMRKFAFATHVGPEFMDWRINFYRADKRSIFWAERIWRTTLIIRVCSGAEGFAPLLRLYIIQTACPRQRNVCADREKLKGNWNGNILITLRVLIKIFPLARPFCAFRLGNSDSICWWWYN